MEQNELKIQRSNDGGISADESRHIEGYAIVFDRPSCVMYDWEKDWDYKEYIDRSAVTQELIDKSDIICRLDHNPDKMLARSKNGKGTLQLAIDDHGLKYAFDAPNTSAGDEALELIRRGDITGSSFIAFAKRDTMKWSKEGKIAKCVITQFTSFFDVSPVQRPAYEATDVTVRSMAEEFMNRQKPAPAPGYTKPKSKVRIL